MQTALPTSMLAGLSPAQFMRKHWQKRPLLVRQAFASRTLRPGGLISGPAQMGVADVAAYALVLAHIGEVAMAVTSSLTIHFLRGAKPGDLHAEGTLLKLGRRIATVEVLVWSESRERAAAKATVAYAIP